MWTSPLQPQLLADKLELSLPICSQPRASPIDCKTRKTPCLRRRRALEAKIRAGIKHAASIVHSPVALDDLPQTIGDWKGRDYRFRLDTHDLCKDWMKGALRSRLREYHLPSPHRSPSQNLPLAHQCSCPTWLVDKNGIAYAIRTELLAWLDDPIPPGSTHPTYQARLNWECEEYQRRCGDNSKQAILKNYRGDHWVSTPGVDRQCKQVCCYTAFAMQTTDCFYRSPTGPNSTAT